MGGGAGSKAQGYPRLHSETRGMSGDGRRTASVKSILVLLKTETHMSALNFKAPNDPKFSRMSVRMRKHAFECAQAHGQLQSRPQGHWSLAFAT